MICIPFMEQYIEGELLSSTSIHNHDMLPILPILPILPVLPILPIPNFLTLVLFYFLTFFMTLARPSPRAMLGTIAITRGILITSVKLVITKARSRFVA